MPRCARLSVAGIPWHIIQRGNNRAACFIAEEDYRRHLDDLSEQSRRFGCAVHAYVLMTNHAGKGSQVQVRGQVRGQVFHYHIAFDMLAAPWSDPNG